jgi:hypothetical protein
VDEAADQVTRAVAVVDLGQAVGHLDLVTVGAGGHVAESQRVRQRLGRRGELAGHDVGQTAFFGLDNGIGVVRDQAAQHRVGVLDVSQVAGAVQAVQAGLGEFGEVADVVQPGGGLDQVGVGAEGRPKSAGPGGDALHVGPAAGKGVGEEGAGKAFGPGCGGLHKSTLVRLAGTFTDAAGRLRTSETSLIPRPSPAG